MPKRKCDENAKENNCGIYSIHCVYIEIMLLVVNSLQKVSKYCIHAFKIKESRRCSHFSVGQNDLGVEYNFLFHTGKTLQEVTPWVPLIFVSLLSKKSVALQSHSQAILVFHCKISTWNCDAIRILERISTNIFLLLSVCSDYGRKLLPTSPTLTTRVRILEHTHTSIISGLSISLCLMHSEQNNVFHFSGLQINQVEKHRVNADMNKLFQVTSFTISPILLHQECTSCTG